MEKFRNKRDDDGGEIVDAIMLDCMWYSRASAGRMVMLSSHSITSGFHFVQLGWKKGRLLIHPEQASP